MREQESDRIKRARTIMYTKKMLKELFGDYLVEHAGYQNMYTIFTISNNASSASEYREVQVKLTGIMRGASGSQHAEINIRNKQSYFFGKRIGLILESQAYVVTLTKDYLDYEDSK